MTASPEPFILTTSPGFPSWLASIPGSLAFTTYQAGKLFLLGVRPDGSLSVFERSFPRCMGIGVSADGRSLALATQIQIQDSTMSSPRAVRRRPGITTRSTRPTPPG